MKKQMRWGWPGAVWAALLAPGLSLLPGLLARTAGGAGWLSVVLALPVMALLGARADVWTREGSGLAAQALRRGLWGRLLTIIYIMSAAVLLAVRLRLGAQRLMSAAQEGNGLWLYLLVLALGGARLAWGTAGMLLRAAGVFWRILLCALGALCLLSLLRLRPEFLWPVEWQALPGVLAGTVSVLGVFGAGVYAAFVPDEGASSRKVGAWLGGGAQALCVLCVLGSLGPALAGRLSDPWLMLARGIGVEGAVRRLEGLVSALWLLADLAYLGLLTQGVRALCPRWGRTAAVALSAVGLVLSLTLLRQTQTARGVQEQLVPALGLLVGIALPLAVRGISCAGKGS